MKILVFLLLLVTCNCLNAQNPTTVNLSSQDNGQKVYVAQDKVRLSPGYSYTGTSNTMRAYIEKHTTYQSLYNNTTFEAVNVNTGLQVGAIDGSQGVSSTGGGTYSIPIKIPSGTNGLMPQLNIAYNSSRGNGMLGIGWDLSGLSAISVVKPTWYQDGKTEGINLNGADRLALDGNRLYATSGTYGANNTIYTTESEQFTKITSYSTGFGPDWFKIETKEGITMEFGKTMDSKIKSNFSNAYISWRVNKIYDTYGNYMEFVYRNENNDSRIDKILYTGNSNKGVLPYNIIQFVYEGRNDANSYFISGNELTSKTLLSKILISSNGLSFKSYEFEYGEDDYSYLRSVTEVGSDGTKLNPTVFQYGDKGLAYQESISTVSLGIYDHINSMGDFNGDGKQDIVLYHETYDNNNVLIHTSWEIKVSTGENSFEHYDSGTVPSGYMLYYSGAYDGNVQGLSSGFDFFGDGKDDLLLVAYSYDYGNINDPSDDTYTNANIIIQSINGNDDTPPPYHPNIIPGGYFELDKFIKIGDFDGDGRDDILYSRYSSPDNLNYTGQLITVHSGVEVTVYTGLSYMYSAGQVFTTDTDGDGKTELAVSYGSSLEMFEFNRNPSNIWVETKILHSTDFNSSQKLYVGDFNGDSKTDIFHYSTGINWRIGYSSAAGFQVKNVSPTPNFISNPGGYFNSIIHINDYNGDGLTDILSAYTNNVQEDWGLMPINTQLDMYYFFGFSPSGDPKKRTLSNVVGTYYDYSDFYPGDFNGDGKAEILTKHATLSKLYSFDKNGEEFFLKRIKNGFGNIVSFDYTWLSKGDNYVKGLGDAFPINDFQEALPVIRGITVPNGIGGTTTETYSYEQAKYHRQGKGFLGFKKVISSNLQTDLRKVQEFEVKLLPYLLILKKETANLISTGMLLSEKVYTNQVIDNNNVRYKIQTTNITENNLLTTVSTTSDFSYDNYGNCLTNTVTNGIESVVTNNSYITFGSWWIPSRLAGSTITRTRTGDPSINVSVNYSYNSNGSIQLITNYPSTPKATMTTHFYDDFGNIIQKSIAATGVTTINNWSTYDAKGRFMISSKNQLGQQTNYTIDQRWGTQTVIETPDDLVTSNIYDAFGNLIFSTSPLGITTSLTRNWDISSGTATSSTPQNKLFSVKIETPNKPHSLKWFDILGRVVQEDVEELNGIVRVVTNYTAKGQVYTQTQPFFPGGSPVYTTNTYDGLGRLISYTNGIATTTISYSASGGQRTRTITGPKGTSSIVTDASGRVINSIDNGGTLSFQYYSSGLEKQISMGGVTLALFEYDQYGNKTKVIDKDGGTILYDFDAFGRLISQTDALGNQYQTVYDVIGREISKTGPDGVTTTTYVNSGNGLNGLKKVTGPNGVFIENEYDQYGHVISQTEFIDGVQYVTNTEYDYVYNRINSMTYPSGYKIRFYYDSNSNIISVKNDAGSVTVFSAPTKNAGGQYTQYTLGNGKTTQKTYDEYGFPLISYAHLTQNLETGFSQTTGNLSFRSDYLKNRSESFDYDNISRLTNSVVGIISNGIALQQIEVDYANNGNINEKTDAGVYQYDANKIHAVVGVENPSGVISSLQQDITYTSFDRTSTITEGTKSLAFIYGPELATKNWTNS